MNFEELTINEVVELAKNENKFAYNYIIRKYKGIIHNRIKKKGFFIQGGDYDDLFQEGLIGLYKAIRDFRPERGEFNDFSIICIDRQLISAIKTATRKKHSPLNEFISLDRSLPENDNLNMMDIFGARDEVLYNIDFETLDPEEQLILTETYSAQKKLLEQTLSSKEKVIYDLYLEHKSYREIMKDLGVENPKMIDNALQRVKKKIGRIKNQEQEILSTVRKTQN